MKLSVKRLFLIATATMVCISACSSDDNPVQTPPPAVSTILDTQAKIDAFGAVGRTVYTDRLVIGVENQPNLSISDLTPLSDLVFVEGLTLFHNELLSDLTGLENLQGIGDEGLLITENPQLTGLAPLAGIGSCGGDIIIRSNVLLPNLTGLDNFTSVEGDLIIEDNRNMTRFNALASLQDVSGDFIIRGNDRLELCMWSSLITVEGSLIIHENPDLEIIDIGTLQTIGEEYSVQANDKLSQIDGDGVAIDGNVGIIDNPFLSNISGLVAVGGTLLIQRNETLAVLNNFVSLESVGGALWFLDNPDLFGFCGLWTFMTGSGFNGSFVAVGNKVNPTIEEIIGCGNSSR